MARSPEDMDHLKLRLLLLVMTGMLGVLVVRLWNIQVVRDDQWRPEGVIKKQSIRRVRLPELRGRIVDRNGVVLADNRPSHSIAVFLEELRQPGPRPVTRTLNKVMSVIEELSFRLQIPAGVVRDDIIDHYRSELLLPYVVWEDVDRAVISRWAERASGLPGVDVFTEAMRVYPHGDLAAHLIGYARPVGKRSDEKERFDYYPPTLKGSAGLEFLLDERLSGSSGGQTLQIDVFGYRNEVLDVRKPQRGDDVRLTIDKEWQSLAEGVLEGEEGAAVIMDVRNGDVLAMATYPRFDLNEFVPTISSRAYKALLNDPRKPLLNRAIQQYYAPGSTFKPVVALAALESGRVTSATTYHCPGYLELGSRRIRCGLRTGHGTIDLPMSLERSCNVYYWRMALHTGYDYIYKMSADVGLGAKSGILARFEDPLGHWLEKPGILPDNAWKWKKYREGWSPGDTCNVAIGQGFLDVTPLQMVNLTATLANGGVLYRPRIILGWKDGETGSFEAEAPEVIRRLEWSESSLRVVQDGMRRVVMSDRGTGRLARLEGLDYAGKTGTAQFGPRGNPLYRTWMIAYAPYENPRYAVALVLESSPDSSSISAAPRMKEIMAGLFGLGEDA